MSKFVPIILLLSSGVAGAGPRTLAVVSGDCDDASLRTSSRVFADALKARLKDQVLDGASASGQLKPRPSGTQEDIQRQLTLAQTHFYNLQHFKAEQQVDLAMKDIELLPPGPERRTLTVSANALRGVIRLGSGKPAQADEPFTRILRLEPTHQLDADYYAPSTRERFEQVRKRLVDAPRANLRVQSNPPGAEVFLDGFNVGKTPFSGRYLTGKYQLLVGRGGATSFPRTVDLNGDTSVQVELAFEGSVKPGEPVCLADLPSRPARLAAAARLGAQLGMEEVVVIGVPKKSDWLTATLVSVNTGQEVREGGMKIRENENAGAFDDLVSYVSTGRASSAVVVAEEGNPPPPWATATVPSNGSASTSVVDPGPTPVGVTSSTDSGLRSKAWIPAVAGGALVAGGTLFAIFARNVEAGVRARNPDITDVDATIRTGQTYERVSVGLFLPGVVALGVSGAMYMMGGSKGGPEVAIVPIEGGAVSVMSGRW